MYTLNAGLRAISKSIFNPSLIEHNSFIMNKYCMYSSTYNMGRTVASV